VPGEGMSGSTSDGEGSGKSNREKNGQVTHGGSSSRNSSVRVMEGGRGGAFVLAGGACAGLLSNIWCDCSELKP
jgi:hypothetical protein